MKITSYINTGNSFPVILESEAGMQFVKLRAGMSGHYGMLTEWFGSSLGIQLGLSTQVPHWVVLEDSVGLGELHPEVKDLIAKSYGLNIGFEYQNNAEAITDRQLKDLNKKELNEIYLFDLMMVNIDRSASNTNLMKVGDEVFSIDYESSLLFQELLENKSLLNDDRILKCLRHNPLYNEIDEAVIDAFIDRAELIAAIDILAEIPLELLSSDQRRSFIKGVEMKKKNRWYLKETMQKLKGIELETKEAYKRRMNKNQDDFKRNFNLKR